MAALVFDIETIGEDFEKIDKVTQKALTRGIEESTDNKDDYKKALEKVKNDLVFSPLTGEIVNIGVLDSDNNTGAVYFRSNDKEIIISYAWSHDNMVQGPSYRLVYDQGLWKLDDACISGMNK